MTKKQSNLVIFGGKAKKMMFADGRSKTIISPHENIADSGVKVKICPRCNHPIPFDPFVVQGGQVVPNETPKVCVSCLHEIAPNE